MKLTALSVLAFAAFFVCSPVLADGELNAKLSNADKDRLANFELSRAAAVKEAKSGGAKADIATLDKVLDGQAASVRNGFNPSGDWQCRTLKLGGQPPLTIYPAFKCKITEDSVGWRLEKISGSQRVSGYFYDDTDTRLVFIGADHYASEKPKAYGEDPQRDAVAYAFNVDAKRIRLEFPDPHFESRFDILELTR